MTNRNCVEAFWYAKCNDSTIFDFCQFNGGTATLFGLDTLRVELSFDAESISSFKEAVCRKADELNANFYREIEKAKCLAAPSFVRMDLSDMSREDREQYCREIAWEEEKAVRRTVNTRRELTRLAEMFQQEDHLFPSWAKRAVDACRRAAFF